MWARVPFTVLVVNAIHSPSSSDNCVTIVILYHHLHHHHQHPVSVAGMTVPTINILIKWTVIRKALVSDKEWNRWSGWKKEGRMWCDDEMIVISVLHDRAQMRAKVKVVSLDYKERRLDRPAGETKEGIEGNFCTCQVFLSAVEEFKNWNYILK